MLYHAYEYAHAAITPMRAFAKFSREMADSPLNLWSQAPAVRASSAALELFENSTRRYGKPEFGIDAVQRNDDLIDISEHVILRKPFCNLVQFKRNLPAEQLQKDPAVLILAPLSGHFATLLRGTVRAMLPKHNVYISDWIDARNVPVSDGKFDLSDYASYIQEFCRELYKTHGRVTVLGVCQPGVPAMAATSLMAEDGDPARPANLVIMGSPIDTRINPTQPCELAMSKPLTWFEQNVVLTVPWPNVGMMRRVYPGFLQLSGFMSMNMDKHMNAHLNQFRHLIKGDGESAAAHRKFYDEYMSVMDMTAEFYLQTIEDVFQNHLLAKGEWTINFNGEVRKVNPAAIKDIGLMTIEGGKDDITGQGQTEAAQALCKNLPENYKKHYTQMDVGHYGIFNGSKWREYIQPEVAKFIRTNRA